MAGKIIADQIEHSTAGSLDTSYVVNGSAKAWVNFDGTGHSKTYSFSSIFMDDNGTGIRCKLLRLHLVHRYGAMIAVSNQTQA
jgi:hypothetical protein